MTDNITNTVSIVSVADYINALDKICDLTQHNLFIFEKNLNDIGFNSSARTDTLRRFLLSNPNNKLQLLAHDTRQITQHCPRLMTLLNQFSHNMAIHQTPKNLQHLTEPFAISDEKHYVRRFHFDDTRGLFVQNDSAQARLLLSKFKEMWQLSQASPWISTFKL